MHDSCKLNDTNGNQWLTNYVKCFGSNRTEWQVEHYMPQSISNIMWWITTKCDDVSNDNEKISYLLMSWVTVFQSKIFKISNICICLPCYDWIKHNNFSVSQPSRVRWCYFNQEAKRVLRGASKIFLINMQYSLYDAILKFSIYAHLSKMSDSKTKTALVGRKWDA